MRALVIAVALSFTGCGFLLGGEPGGGGGLPGGRACASNEDCVPSDCCGEGSGVVHVMDAPSCSGRTCTSNCPQNQTDCGCGVPICRDSRCTVAVATDPMCE
ncbi:MAG: hypothetical protein ACO1OB_15865 [Archangium sp.]